MRTFLTNRETTPPRRNYCHILSSHSQLTSPHHRWSASYGEHRSDGVSEVRPDRAPGKGFASAAHMASYAGLAPITRRSGTSSAASTPTGSAPRCLNTPGQETQPGPHPLAHCRCDVLFAALPGDTLYDALPTRCRLTNAIEAPATESPSEGRYRMTS